MKKKKFKKYILTLTVAFVAIVTGLAGSASVLHNRSIKDWGATATVNDGSRIVVNNVSEKELKKIEEKNLPHKEISKGTYIVSYPDPVESTKALTKDFASKDAPRATNDEIFRIATEETPQVLEETEEEKQITFSTSVPEGETLRQYADEQGKKLVAVIDTGVNETATESVSFVPGQGIKDVNGHGTEVAKKIMESSGDGAVILSLKALADNGDGYMSNVMQAIQYAREAKVDIINMSFVGVDTGAMQVFSDMIKDAIKDGIKVVAAAGNNGGTATVCVPANIEGVLSVGAMDSDHNKKEFSNFNAKYYEEAESTSLAAAILTSKLVTGQSLSEEVTDVKYNEEKIAPTFVTNGEQGATRTLDGKDEAYRELLFRIDPTVQARVNKHKSKRILLTSSDVSDYIKGYTEMVHDKKYGSYVYFFENEEDCEKAITDAKKDPSVPLLFSTVLDDVPEMSTAAWTPTVQNDSAVVNGRFKLRVQAAGQNGQIWGKSFVVNGRSDGYQSSLDCGGEYRLYVEGPDNNNENNVVLAEHKEDYGFWFHYYKDDDPRNTVWEGYSKGIYQKPTVTVWSGLRLNGTLWGPANSPMVWVSVTTSTGYNPPKPKHVLNVDLVDKNGTEKTDGSLGTFEWTRGDFSNQPVSDVWTQLEEGTLYRIGRLKLKPGYRVDTITMNGSQIPPDTLNGDGHVWALNSDAHFIVKIVPADFDLTIDPAGGTYNGNSSPTTITGGVTHGGTKNNGIAPATRPGYRFTGYYDSSNNLVYDPSGHATSAGNHWKGSYPNCTYNDQGPLRVTARWTPQSYDLEVDPTGGTFKGTSNPTVLKNYVTYDSNQGSTIERAAKKGFTFAGFTDATNGGSGAYDQSGNAVNGKYWNGSGYGARWKFTRAARIYAQWHENTYTIHYDGNGADGGSTPDQSVLYTHDVQLAHNGFTRTGYKFKGWAKERDGRGDQYNEGQTVSRLTDQPNGSVTFYAQWEPIKYKVRFDSNSSRHVREGQNIPFDQYTTETEQRVSGRMGQQIDATYDKSFTLPRNGYQWEGHTFLGWAKSPNATVQEYGDGQSTRNLTATENETVTLYAVWRADRHTLTVDAGQDGAWNGYQGVTQANGGNTYWGDKIQLGAARPYPKSATISYDKQADDAVIDRTFDRVDYVFSNWEVLNKKNSNGKIFGNEVENVQNCYYVLQDTDDSVRAKYYFRSVILPTPTRPGYNFLGWYTDPDCMHKATDKEGSRGNGGDHYHTETDITLYARWEKQVYDYADNVQAYMQDRHDDSDNGGGNNHAYIRKIDSSTGQPIGTSESGRGVVIGVYNGTSTYGIPIFKLDTSRGILDSRDSILVDKSQSDANGWYDVTQFLTKGQTYTVHEISTIEGYGIAPDQTFTYKGDKRVQINVKNKKYKPENRVTTVKKDFYGREIANATFELWDETENRMAQEFKTNDKGEFVIPDHSDNRKIYDFCIAGHSYRLTETVVPDGFKKAKDFKFSMPENADAPLKPIYIDEAVEKPGSLEIKKVDSDDTPLEGAEFQLFMKDKDGEYVPCFMNRNTGEWVNATEESGDIVLMKATSMKDGVARFNGLPLRANYTGSEPDFTKSYYLKETKAPKGYNILPGYMEVRLPDDGDGKKLTYTVKDDSIVLTLEAGGTGTALYVGIGVVILSAAIFLVVNKNKKIA